MRTNSFLGRDFIDAEFDYTKEEWETMIEVALYLKRKHALNEPQNYILRDKTLFAMFYNQSLRTRTTFVAGINQLGGFAQILDTKTIYAPALKGEEIAYSTERISDVARVLSRIGDAIAIRIYGEKTDWVYGKGNAIIKEFAKYSEAPLINMECDKFHPTQALADMITIKEKFGGFKGKKICMSWAYSDSFEKPLAVPQSVVLAATKMGMDVVLAHPKGFELTPEVIEKSKQFAKEAGGSLSFTNDMEEGFHGCDVVYPKSWGVVEAFAPKRGVPHNEKLMEERFTANKHWICTEKTMKAAKEGAYYMHCLPADRGQEVVDEVIDGNQSIVFDEAENRLHAHKAIMALIMGGRL